MSTSGASISTAAAGAAPAGEQSTASAEPPPNPSILKRPGAPDSKATGAGEPATERVPDEVVRPPEP
ncbi:MAG: hypothetical protein FJX56_12240 [Alphaproteobacteria bacterium]|nr:hypothetical protein [Alphaproteobacteria bacterium]